MTAILSWMFYNYRDCPSTSSFDAKWSDSPMFPTKVPELKKIAERSPVSTLAPCELAICFRLSIKREMMIEVKLFSSSLVRYREKGEKIAPYSSRNVVPGERLNRSGWRRKWWEPRFRDDGRPLTMLSVRIWKTLSTNSALSDIIIQEDFLIKARSDTHTKKTVPVVILSERSDTTW